MQDKTAPIKTSGISQPIFLVSGVVAVVIGLTGGIFGSAWSPQTYEFFAGIEVMQFIDTFMPYFPFVPFYPIFIIVLGAFLIVKSRG